MVLGLGKAAKSRRIRLDGTHNLRTGSGDAKHPKVVFQSSVLGCDRGGGDAILQSVDLVAFFVGSPHSRFDTTVGQEAAQNNVLGTPLTE